MENYPNLPAIVKSIANGETDVQVSNLLQRTLECKSLEYSNESIQGSSIVFRAVTP